MWSITETLISCLADYKVEGWVTKLPFHCRNKIGKNTNAEHHHALESFHLSGHTFRFRWTVQDLEVFLV